MATKGKKAPDWPEIEREYRCGAFSTREIGRRHGISESTIRSRAKRDKWEQDLKARYQKELRIQRIARDGRARAFRKRNPRAEADPALDEAAIKKASGVGNDRIDHHRELLSLQAVGLMGIQLQINKQLEAAKGTKMPTDELRAVSQAQRQASGALASVIAWDRRSYNLDDTIDENMPDAVQITFHRRKPPPKVEE